MDKVYLVSNWIMGLFFILTSALVFPESILAGFSLLMIALLLLPPVREFTHKVVGLKVNGVVRFIMCLFLIGFLGASIPDKNKSEGTPASYEAKQKQEKEIQIVVFSLSAILAVFGVLILIRRKDIIGKAEEKANNLLEETEESASAKIQDANQKVDLAELRVDRLKNTDGELVKRLKATRELLEKITDIGSRTAADIELINEEDLLTSSEYQEDRKQVSAKLKKLACNAIVGAEGHNSDVNIGKFIAISAKADMAGALLLTTVEMLCSKITHSNGVQATEKLETSILATEALIKALDSRATLNGVFRALLMERLHIEINYKRAKQIAKEEQRELREQEKEERKARQEAERVQKEAEKEEEIKQKAIEEIEAKMKEENDVEREKHNEQLMLLKQELQELHEKSERAKSRAQETRQGHVYVISNIGSFGEEILKIGMTRRLNPLDRVKELGDASVPFSFDIHALIESDDAPDLEKQLHRVFNDRRVNKVNLRKEYFKVNIEEIEKRLEEVGVSALISKVASADEYYKSLKISELKELNESEMRHHGSAIDNDVEIV